MATTLGLAGALPHQSFAASGNYDAMLLACIDPRFPKLTLDHMTRRAMVGKYSQFNIAGAAIGAVASRDKETATHRNALMTFKNDVAIRFPKLRVELGLMDLNGKVESIT